MEGILLLHYTRLHKFYTLKVFIETPEHIRISRRINETFNLEEEPKTP